MYLILSHTPHTLPNDWCSGWTGWEQRDAVTSVVYSAPYGHRCRFKLHRLKILKRKISYNLQSSHDLKILKWIEMLLAIVFIVEYYSHTLRYSAHLLDMLKFHYSIVVYTNKYIGTLIIWCSHAQCINVLKPHIYTWTEPNLPHNGLITRNVRLYAFSVFKQGPFCNSHVNLL